MNLKNINFYQKKAEDFNFLTRLYQYYTIFILLKPFIEFPFYNIKIENEFKPEKGKNYILAPNHISYLDVFFVNMAYGRKLAYIAKQELFKTETFAQRYVAKNIYRLGAFALNREKVGLSTIKSVKEVFKAKYDLCIFPQGGIRKNRTIENINGGFIYFAKTNKVDIVPMGITGFEEYNWKPFKKKDVSIKIGKPISYELPEEEILKLWCEQVATMANYKNAQEN
ncbi:MAG: 1-acyl-sn-glycerol-3-phosphate acyltransferase [Candidatus Gastranaerophilales bacterium]|nr:1-acyl-sn-glycerol-3-phosphate acyltransferase [Candidatus Gastranaerophilales bacterium]